MAYQAGAYPAFYEMIRKHKLSYLFQDELVLLLQ